MAGVRGRSGGRNAVSTQEHQARGTHRNDRHGGATTPDPPKGIPFPPKEIEGDAKEEWVRMVGRLSLSGTLSVVDDGVLYQYCRLFAETEAIALSQSEVAASVDLLEENIAGLEGAELVQVFQEISKMRQLEAKYTTSIRQGRMAIRAYLVEFGQTPSARSRVKIATQAATDGIEDELVN